MPFFERRQSPRVAQSQALITHVTGAFQVDIMDFSSGGICIKRPRDWPFNINDAVVVYILAGPGAALQRDALIVWYQDDEIGLQFQ